MGIRAPGEHAASYPTPNLPYRYIGPPTNLLATMLVTCFIPVIVMNMLHTLTMYHSAHANQSIDYRTLDLTPLVTPLARVPSPHPPHPASPRSSCSLLPIPAVCGKAPGSNKPRQVLTIQNTVAPTMTPYRPIPKQLAPVHVPCG